jgi:hypothetical protein
LLDRYLGQCGYSSQLSNEKIGTNAPEKLFEPVPGEYGAHGRFNGEAKHGSWEMFTSRELLSHQSRRWQEQIGLVSS